MSTTQVVAQLFQLQQLDLELDRLRAEQQALIASLKGTRTLQKLRAECTTLEQQLQGSQQARGEAEWAREDISSRLSEREQRLKEKKESGQDVQSVQEEVKQLQVQLSRQEELVLQATDAEEFLHELVTRKQTLLEQEEASWRNENVAGISRRDQIEARLAELNVERTHVTENVDPDLLQRYDGMRKTKQGRAVSKVEQNSCEWCRAVLTPSELQKVRVSPILQTCTNCGRILYYDSP